MALLRYIFHEEGKGKCTHEVTKEIESKSFVAVAAKLAVNGSLPKWRLVTSGVHIGASVI